MKNVLYINKPVGISSFDICYKLRKTLNTKKIGHTGTLDPNASGVMIIVFDKATKTVPFLVSHNKQYKTKVLFGKRTDTLDITGNLIEEREYVIPNENEIKSVLKSFLGKSKQVVPITSAKKVNGKKLYEYQLKGEKVELPIIDIEIYDIELNEVLEDGFIFTTTVSSGTYIRALVRDILDKLDLIGTIDQLCRTKIDDVDISECDELSGAIDGKYNLHDTHDLLSKKYKTINIRNIEDIKNGKRIKLDCDDEFVLLENNNEPLAIYRKENDEYINVRGLW